MCHLTFGDLGHLSGIFPSSVEFMSRARSLAPRSDIEIPLVSDCPFLVVHHVTKYYVLFNAKYLQYTVQYARYI